MIDKDLLNILVCPKCKEDIRLTKNNKYIICDNCNLVFEIKVDTPIMLIDEAKNKDDLPESEVE